MIIIFGLWMSTLEIISPEVKMGLFSFHDNNKNKLSSGFSIVGSYKISNHANNFAP